ncbi:hypothetical protein MTR72_39845 [Bradyrhizobium sp. ISRA442]|uniref:hypothetical protein n=1 Tax=Bradyrhizobium sp. ISRA442 TaxID=2866197 RepID=UPI00311AFA38
MSIFVPIINLIWVGLFVVALYSHSDEVGRWFALWTCGMIGFFFGCVYKGQQQSIERSNDVLQKELERLAAREVHEEEWEREHPGWCGRCEGATKRPPNLG